MKIKRFEAASMSEALRKIKKEFGEEAVILSAKSVKKNGLLGMSKSGQVVVTAAIDRAPAIQSAKDIDVIVNSNSDASENKSVSKSSGGINILKRFNPITLTGQKKVKPKIVQLMSASEERPKERCLYDLLRLKGISDEIAADMESKAGALLPQDSVATQDYLSALTQVVEAKELIGTVKTKNQSKPRIVVMLGPSGVGKTSAAVKLCAKHTMQLQESAALISFDNQRVAGMVELERYAHILGVPFKTIFDVDDVNTVMTEVADVDLVIIDTPGLAADDHILCEQLRRLVTSLNEPERYLLINADAQEKVMARIIGFCRPLGIQRLFFTKLDWAVDIGPLINQVVASNLPVAYLSDSSKVPEGIRVATAHDLAGRLIPQSQHQPVLSDDPTVTVIQSQDPGHHGVYYVANRNSDIFHLNNCNAVKRINTDNMIVFKDPSEAIGRQFKPCRMCCSELIFPKPTDRLARGYAGHRYYHQ